jgi:hypothetical protein
VHVAGIDVQFVRGAFSKPVLSGSCSATPRVFAGVGLSGFLAMLSGILQGSQAASADGHAASKALGQPLDKAKDSDRDLSKDADRDSAKRDARSVPAPAESRIEASIAKPVLPVLFRSSTMEPPQTSGAATAVGCDHSGGQIVSPGPLAFSDASLAAGGKPPVGPTREGRPPVLPVAFLLHLTAKAPSSAPAIPQAEASKAQASNQSPRLDLPGARTASPGGMGKSDSLLVATQEPDAPHGNSESLVREDSRPAPAERHDLPQERSLPPGLSSDERTGFTLKSTDRDRPASNTTGTQDSSLDPAESPVPLVQVAGRVTVDTPPVPRIESSIAQPNAVSTAVPVGSRSSAPANGEAFAELVRSAPAPVTLPDAPIACAQPSTVSASVPPFLPSSESDAARNSSPRFVRAPLVQSDALAAGEDAHGAAEAEPKHSPIPVRSQDAGPFERVGRQANLETEPTNPRLASVEKPDLAPPFPSRTTTRKEGPVAGQDWIAPTPPAVRSGASDPQTDQGEINQGRAERPTTEPEISSAVHPQPTRQVSLRLESAESGNVDLLLRERGGHVQVAVRTGDQQLARTLQSDLGDLVNRLENRGFKTESWVPGSTHHATAWMPGSSQAADPEHSGSPAGERHGQQQSNQRRQPRWTGQFEETLETEEARMDNK